MIQIRSIITRVFAFNNNFLMKVISNERDESAFDVYLFYTGAIDKHPNL